MIAALFLAVLVDFAPGFAWNDPGGLLPTRVSPVPVESLRIGRDLAGEFYGAFSAAAERNLYANDSLMYFVRDNTRTNDCYSLEARPLASNRTIRTTRIADHSLFADSISCLRPAFIPSGFTSSRYLGSAEIWLPAFGWTSNLWGQVESNVLEWLFVSADFRAAAGDGILDFDEDYSYASDMFDMFVNPKSYSDVEEVLNPVSFYGFEDARPASPASLLDDWMSEIYGSVTTNPPAASMLTNETLRLDRKRLTALDYTCALVDRQWYRCDDPVFYQTDVSYSRSRVVDGRDAHASYSYSGGAFTVSASPNWYAETTNVVAITNEPYSVRAAVFATTGDQVTNAYFSASLTIPLVTTYEAVTNYLHAHLDAKARQAASEDGIPFECVTDYVLRDLWEGQPTLDDVMNRRAATVGELQACYTNAWGKSTLCYAWSNPDIPVALTNVDFVCQARESRAARIAATWNAVPQPLSEYDAWRFDYGLWSRGWAWEFCSRFVCDPPAVDQDSWLWHLDGISMSPGEGDYCENKLGSGVEYSGTNGYALAIVRAGNSAIDDAAELMRRRFGADVRDIESYIALPDGPLASAKSAAASPGAMRAELDVSTMPEYWWNLADNTITIRTWVYNDYYSEGRSVTVGPGAIIELGRIVATTNGVAGYLPALPPGCAFGHRRLCWYFPLHFKNCDQR